MKPQKNQKTQPLKNNSALAYKKKEELAMGKINFILIAASFALVVIGFLLMLGGNTTDESFNPDIFSTRRIAIGPTIAFLGFVCIVPAVLYRPKKKRDNTETEE